MQARILIDREGSVTPPGDFQLITSEVEFLRYALDDGRLFIRGRKLGEWAERFYRGRGMDYQVIKPSYQIVQEQLLIENEDEAKRIAELLGNELDQPQPLNLITVLQVLYPVSLWEQPPSYEHAAEWLIWLIEEEPDPAITPLLHQMTEQWARRVVSPLDSLYQGVTTPEVARERLDQWLLLSSESKPHISEVFPIELPSSLQGYFRKRWREQLVETNGQCINRILSSVYSSSLKRLIAQEAFDFFKGHPERLTKREFNLLAPYLSRRQQEKLLAHLPPPEPGPLPNDPLDVLKWFQEMYFPYRSWHHFINQDRDSAAKARILELGRQFAQWYLPAYRKALTGSDMHRLLSFHRMSRLRSQRQNNQAITLVLMMDGLHWGDAEKFRSKLEEKTKRLTLVQPGKSSDVLAFGIIPTVTEISKDAIFKGVPPKYAEDRQPLGEVIQDRKLPIERLNQAKPGSIFFWRLRDPDFTYHQRNTADALSTEIDSRLDEIAEKLGELVEGVSAHLELRVIVTTDHGRFLGVSERGLQVPDGMKSHGRAAWGDTSMGFPEEGFVLKDEVAYLCGDSFYLSSQAAAVSVGDRSFLNNDGSRGQERYPHGGLFPEEVIVPWFEYVRDFQEPDIHISMAGEAMAGRAGTISVQVRNYSDLPIVVVGFEIIREDGITSLDTNQQIQALSKQQFDVPLSQWPDQEALDKLEIKAKILLPNGIALEIPVEVSLKVLAMYEQDNILDDLGLDL